MQNTAAGVQFCLTKADRDGLKVKCLWIGSGILLRFSSHLVNIQHTVNVLLRLLLVSHKLLREQAQFVYLL